MVWPKGVCQNANLNPASVLMGAQVLLSLYVLRVQKDSVQHIIFVGEVFQIELTEGLVHPLGSR